MSSRTAFQSRLRGTQNRDLKQQPLEPGSELDLEVTLADGSTTRTTLALPPGSPGRPPTDAELDRKIKDCVGDAYPRLLTVTWRDAPEALREAVDAPRLDQRPPEPPT